MPETLRLFFIFLYLGCTSFGGPVAHLGYFRAAFVQQLKWLTEQQYADLVALCQFMPGPASSQVGLSIGLLRGGYLGALAAWLGFTLPSAVLLTLFALGLNQWQGAALEGAVHGLKIAAVAVVAQAVWQMGRRYGRWAGGMADGQAVLPFDRCLHRDAAYLRGVAVFPRYCGTNHHDVSSSGRGCGGDEYRCSGRCA